MSWHNYSAKVGKDLHRLTLLAQTRLKVVNLTSIMTIIKKWQDGEISEDGALESISKLLIKKEPSWSEGADPGVPVAQAVTESVLSREDMDDETWLSIEHLVTLAEM